MDTRALQILASWFSPAYPVGAFAYSHGLEWAVEAGEVTEGAGLQAWVSDVLAFGTGRNDAILLAHAWRAPDPAPLAELALALAPSSERRLETCAQGAAFARTTRDVWGVALPNMAYPVAVGRAARLIGLPLAPVVTLYLQAFAAALVSAGVRLVPLGQTEGQKITAALMAPCAQVAEAALDAPLEALGGMTLCADLAAMRHETQRTRLYRS